MTMSECTHDCSTCGESCADRTQPQSFLKEYKPRRPGGKVFGVVSGKGGVGKEHGHQPAGGAHGPEGLQVGVLDADVTGPSIPKAFGVPPAGHGRRPGNAPGAHRRRHPADERQPAAGQRDGPGCCGGAPSSAGVVTQFWTDVVWDVDYLFVDMPPGTGDVALSVFQSLPLDGIIIVASPQELVSMVVEKAVKMAEMMDIPIVGVVENMSYLICPDCGKEIPLFGQGKTQAAAEAHSLKLLARMPIDPKLAELADAGRIEDFQGQWLTPVADVLEKFEN